MITINKHSSIKITGEKTVYFDPFGIDSAAHDADIIFFTHSHYDHFSPEDAKKCANADTVFVAPLSCEKELAKKGFENTVYLTAGDKTTVNGISTEAVPAYNKIKPFHPKSNGWLGFIVTVDGERIYVAGDTDNLTENTLIECDTALVPVGGVFTMTAKDAAAFVNALKPKKAIPTHYGSIAGKPGDGVEFIRLVDGNIQTELLIR